MEQQFNFFMGSGFAYNKELNVQLSPSIII
jgi:hypothetical protein